jgi:hypothetical protein
MAAVQAVVALALAFGLDLSTEQVGAILAVSAAALGLVTRSQVTPTASCAPQPEPADVGAIGIGLVLRVLAFVCFVVFMFVGFDWVTAAHPFGWLGAGLALWLLSTFTD